MRRWEEACERRKEMFEMMMVFQCKGSARRVPGKRPTEKKRQRNEREGEEWCRTVEERERIRDLVKVIQREEQGTKSAARAVGKDNIVAAKT